MKTQHTTYLSLGTNEGLKLENLQNAIDFIGNTVGSVLKIAPVYKTASWGFNGNEFLNTCIKVATHLTAEVLILQLLAIEDTLGRIRKNATGYTNRVIDIDILLFDNEIINSKNLIVPHPRMLERSFVLIPLTAIAKSTLHPKTKKTLQECLSACEDTSKVSVITEHLKLPFTLTEKYNYIAIEGNIGAGKTSLTKMISNTYNYKTILERFSDNAFLPKFYKNKDRYAFPLEMSFLEDRHQQLSDDLTQISSFKDHIISDYSIFKSLIFAHINLEKDEYILYKKMFDIIFKDIKKPDLYIYLYQNTTRLLQNIKKRGRNYELDIKASYLEKIQQGYINFITTKPDLNVLTIDVSDLDFVNNKKDFNTIIKKIEEHSSSLF